MVRESAVPKQSRQHRQSLIGQCLIDEGLLPFEGFCCAAAWQTISVQFALYDFGEKLCDGSQPEPVSPVPSIQGFTQNELPSVGIVAQVQPIIDFTPFLRALRDGGSRFPSVDTADHHVYAIQPSFRIQPLWNTLPIQPPEEIQPVRENHRFIETDLRLTERLYAPKQFNGWIQKHECRALWIDDQVEGPPGPRSSE
jgi:hypothetical protein